MSALASRIIRAVLITCTVMGIVFFVARDAQLWSSLTVLIALAAAACAHYVRQAGFKIESTEGQNLWNTIKSIKWEALILLAFEWLAIAIAGYYLLNPVHSPFSNFIKAISCVFA